MGDGVLGVDVGDAAGVHDQGSWSVAAAGQASLHRVHDGEVLDDGGRPVEFDDLALLRREVGAVELPLADEHRPVGGHRDSAELVEDQPMPGRRHLRRLSDECQARATRLSDRGRRGINARGILDAAEGCGIDLAFLTLPGAVTLRTTVVRTGSLRSATRRGTAATGS